MDSYCTRQKWQSDSSATSNENELSNTHYDDTNISVHNSASCFTGSLNKENAGLSLELEITESLKNIISSPKQCDSALVDVTIIRPEEIEETKDKMETNTIRTSEVRNLIASMERHKENRKKLIEECKSILTGNPRPTKADKNRLCVRSESIEPHLLQAARRNLRKNKNTAKQNSPTQEASNLRKLTKRAFTASQGFSGLTGEGSLVTHSADMLKHMEGRGSVPFKIIEARNVEIGDHKQKRSRTPNKIIENQLLTDTSNSSELLDFKQFTDSMVPDSCESTHTQVYATVRTFDKLKTKLVCQNKEQRDGQKPQTPCLCQHCGMVGLLVESQKRPFIGEEELLDPEIVKQQQLKNSKDKTKVVKVKDSKSQRYVKLSDVKDFAEYEMLLYDLSDRIKTLEFRIKEHENKAVPKDYFKKVMNKMLSYLNPRCDQRLKYEHVHGLKNIATQYSIVCIHNESRTRRQERKKYTVHPVLVNEDNSTRMENKATDVTATKTVSIITDFFSGNKADKAVDKKVTEKVGESAIDSFWKWGEEIIKPGVDLKDKIVSLLEDKLNSGRVTEVRRKTSSDKTLYLGDCEKDNRSIPNKNRNLGNKDKDSTLCTAGGSFKKFLDVMSTKVYNEQVANKVCKYNSEPKHAVDAKKAANDNFFKQNMQARKENEAKVSDTVRTDTFTNNSENNTSMEVCKNSKESESKRSTVFFQPSAYTNEINNSSMYESNERGVRKNNYKEAVKEPVKQKGVGDKKYAKSNIPVRKPSFTYRAKPKKTAKVSLPAKPKHTTKYQRDSETTEHHALEDEMYSKTRRQEVIKNPLRIKYMNPKANDWDEDSCTPDEKGNTEGALQRKRLQGGRPTNDQEKIKTVEKVNNNDDMNYLKKVSNAKEDKAEFWRNLWMQAKKFGKSKQDKVTIQIPLKTNGDMSKGKDFREMELTIGELEEMVKKYDKKVISPSSSNASLVDKHKKMSNAVKTEKGSARKKNTLKNNS